MSPETRPRVIAVDWSGARKGAHRKIWLAEVVGGRMVRLESGRSREEVTAHLVEEAERDPAVVVGLDFAFSFPAWFCRELGAEDGPDVWRAVAERGEDWLAECTDPFWGRPGRKRPELREHFRATETEAATRVGSQPKSVFQIGGAGAVGTGSIRGMPHLLTLREGGFSVFPFDAPSLPLVLEIYPRTLTGPVKKSSREARTAYLDGRFPEMTDEQRADAAGSDDAFDAAVSAVMMHRHLGEILGLERGSGTVEGLEGTIWSPAEDVGEDVPPPREAATAATEPGPPPPRDQIRFLQQLQRLLDEGSFTATYKFALLHAIADLCVTLGDDSGAALSMGTDQIAERFIELYWRQAQPLHGPELSTVLLQNTGPQAAIVRRVREARERYDGSLARFQRSEDGWDRLRAQVERDVRRYPVLKLQNIGGEPLEFLYETEGGREVTLLPGVAYCFRAFYPLIVDLVEGAWSQYVRRYNQEALGSTIELRSFLFGSERSALDRVRPVLTDLQEDACFYCGGRLRSDVHVDHFIPWRRYPVDLGHNFVLAHDRCNVRKGDRLAAVEHLARWTERNDVHAALLEERFLDAGVPADPAASTNVARWAYAEVERAGGTVWVQGSEVRSLTGAWRAVFA